MEQTANRNGFLHNLRYRRDRYRQALGILFVILVSALAQPQLLPAGIGCMLIIAGVIVRLWASGHIHKNRELATTGPYALVRHPLYVGNLLLLAGFAFASNLWWSWLLLAAILAGFYPPAIQREDEYLHGKFGHAWERWRDTTRAVLPRFDGERRWREGEWSLARSLKQNGEPLIAAFLLLCAFLLLSRLP